MDILDFSAESERINIKANVEMVLVSMVSRKSSGTIHLTDFKHVYGQIMSRLDSALDSALLLYKRGEIDSSKFSYYFSRHDRVVSALLTLIKIKEYRELMIYGDDYHIELLIKSLQTLNEVAEQLQHS